jgi:DNA-binding MurR/RpiR family transcriptional regulator
MPLRTRLIAQADALPQIQRRLAAYLLEHYLTASDLTISELADAAGVSLGTVSGLCRRLGLAGYQELRLAIAREAVAFTPVSDETDEESRDGLDPALERAIARSIQAGVEAIDQTGRNLDREALTLACTLLRSAGRIVFVGVGSAGYVAGEASLKLRKLGLPASHHFDSHEQAIDASLLGPGDVVLVVSHSGRTQDVLRAVDIARFAGAHVIAVTSGSRSPLSDCADVLLATVSHDTAFLVEPMASTLAATAILHLVFLVLLEQGGEDAVRNYNRTQVATDQQGEGRSR